MHIPCGTAQLAHSGLKRRVSHSKFKLEDMAKNSELIVIAFLRRTRYNKDQLYLFALQIVIEILRTSNE